MPIKAADDYPAGSTPSYVRLADAGAPYGLSVDALLAQHAAGRLTIYRVGRRIFTTAADIESMFQLCRVDAHARETSAFPLSSGSSGDEGDSLARDSLLMNVQKLKEKLRAEEREKRQQKSGPRHAD